MRVVWCFLLAAVASPAWAVEVDGRIDPQEWAGAEHITDFRLTQPLSRGPAPQATEAWVLSTPEGLAVAFRNQQPVGVTRTRQRSERDGMGPVDRVNVNVDFDGDGRTGYNFCVSLSNSISDEVITNENAFNDDWDGNWRHATAEDETGWSVEILIPWHIAPMRDGKDGKRTLAVNLDRVIGITGERVAWPAISFMEPRFLSSFGKLTLPAYNQSLLAITPFVTGIYDNAGGTGDLDAGADLFWKPSGRFQMTATLNPDFGQVESDDLVVNFSAVESFFNDKRPFFTENQGVFEVPYGSGDSRLLYTRRIGGPADDGDGAGDVAAAIKLNGSLGRFNYGVLAASESGTAGRDFYALRITRESDVHDFGAMLTHVERPFFDRQATVFSFDHRYTPNERWDMRSLIVGSSIRQAGATMQDNGFQVRADHDFGAPGGWRQQFWALHSGRDLQLNDIGYLDRNDYNYLRYELSRRRGDYPSASRYTDSLWRYRTALRYNDGGLHLYDSVAVSRQSETRNGGNEFWEASAYGSGYDDRILRGNGVLRIPAKAIVHYESFRPRRHHWAFYAESRVAVEGLPGATGIGGYAYLEPQYHFSDRMNLAVGLWLQHSPQWVLWQQDNLLGTFQADTLQVNSSFNWIVGNRQELRVKLQAIGLDARTRQAWRVAADGTPVRSADAVPDFSLRNLGFQVRYRYELAPLSDLYVVYARGGAMTDAFSRDAERQLADSFDLRNDEQLMVKLSYRFEL